ncbi:MAG: hypothetical protein IKJ52_07075 [Muribaculaceae bacterium]|nr:hypothetical protein [Muribaculaceae bacterium]
MSLANYSCKSIRTIEVEKPVYIHDTTEVLTQRLDSIFVDRYHEIYSSSDTVFIRDSISVVHYKVEKDTVYSYIEKPIEVTKAVLMGNDNERNSFKDILAWSGAVAILVCVVYIVWVRKKT